MIDYYKQTNIFMKNFQDIMRYVEQHTWEFFIDNAKKHNLMEREGQQNMALDIVGAIRDNRHIVAEAGVGIGKSYAYIVPLLYYHQKTSEPIAIATSTIALQEQLVGDIETICQKIGYPVEIVLAKGQTHFVCRRRAEEYLSGKSGFADILGQIHAGAFDRSEFLPEVNSAVWNQINIKEFNYGECSRCADKWKCGYLSLRSAMQQTEGVILCNQDLLTVHLKKMQEGQRPILNDRIGIMVVDEAHNLEEKVRNAYTIKYGKGQIDKRAKDLQRSIHITDLPFLAHMDEFLHNVDALYNLLNQDVKAQISQSSVDMKYAERFYFHETPEITTTLVKISKLADDVINMAYLSSDTVSKYGHGLKESSDLAIEAFSDVASFFSVFSRSRGNYLFWVERDSRRLQLVSCPKQIASRIKDLYYQHGHTTILTSATITNTTDGPLESQYGYFIKNTDFPSETDNGFLADPQPSPFPYDEHAMLYYCGDLPHPTDERDAFLEGGAKRIEELLKISHGRALVLFTAKTDMETVYAQLCNNGLPYKILMQTPGSSQDKILKEFQEDETSVLLGTGAYWEGINIKGKSLSNLIIFRLPFPVPDPVMDYKRAQAENPLMDVNVPEMIIKCKQGIGRLIRSDKDKGIAAIIDPRLGDAATVPYKQLLWDALPIKNRTNSIHLLKAFYDSVI